MKKSGKREGEVAILHGSLKKKQEYKIFKELLNYNETFQEYFRM